MYFRILQSLPTKHSSTYAVAKLKHNDVKNRFENIFPCELSTFRSMQDAV